VERVSDFKEILEDKNVKLVALNLGSMSLFGGLIYVPKELEKRKDKIRTWEKMKFKLKDCFLLPLTFKGVTPNYTT